MPQNFPKNKSYENGLIKQNLFYLFFSFFVSRKNITFYELCIWKKLCAWYLNVDEGIDKAKA